MSDITTKLCSVAYADGFLGEHRWSENWTASTAAGKSEALVNATNVIQRFCTFVDSDGEALSYNPESEADEGIPDWLRQACCYEALYFLDLDNDPARPFPLGILGLIKSGSDSFSHDYEPPLFSQMAKAVIEKNGGTVNDPNKDSAGWERKMFI